MNDISDHRWPTANNTRKTERLRIGALGAARITPLALLQPAGRVAGVQVTAIASRSPKRAAALARQYNIPTFYDSYEKLLSAPDIDAVYIALPNAYHAEYIVQALRQNRHVLCEKPLTSNAGEALAVQAAAAEHPHLVLMDAYHWRYHPVAEEIVRTVPQIGSLRSIDLVDAFPLLRPHDIRWDIALGGGAMMDVGCYPLSLITLLSDRQPAVVAARAQTIRGDVDRRMDARLRLDCGTPISVTASMLSHKVASQQARITGEHGRVLVRNLFTAHHHGRLTFTPTRGRQEHVHYPAQPTTYEYQLRAFAGAINGTDVNRTPPSESARIMSLIDDIYRTAGLRPRPGRLPFIEGSTRTP